MPNANTSVTTRLRLTTPFPRPVLHTKNTAHLPINKVTPSYSTSHIPPTANVHMHIVCFTLLLLFLSVISAVFNSRPSGRKDANKLID